MDGQIGILNDRPPSLRSEPLIDGRHGVPRRVLVFGAVAAAIVVLDQSLKWWAWRNVAAAHINYGGDNLVPATVGSWYGRPVTGALLDLFDFGLLFTLAALLLRRRRSGPVLISATAIISGWSSNLLDRLFMHYWTAPGSVRGVVDFIPIGQRVYNVADLFIIAATPSFVLALFVPALRRLIIKRPSLNAHSTPRPRPRRTPRVQTAVWALGTGCLLTAIVGVGAATFGGATAPIASAGAGYQRTVIARHSISHELP
ncbi:signal peptidase II [Jatrophihabitans sp. DSM 45814]